MKQCPQCRTTYTDEELKFCLQDGSRLIGVQDFQSSNANWNETETATVIKQPHPTNPQFQQNTSFETVQTNKRSVLPIVLISILGTLFLVGGGLAAWYLLKKDDKNIAVNTNAGKSENLILVPTVAPTVKLTPAPTPIKIPTAEPTISPEIDTAAIKKDVQNFLDLWKADSESGNLDATMENYADRVDYYRKSGATKDFIRRDKERALNAYDSIELNIGNVQITPEGDGNTATAVFDKEWFFENDVKTNSGKVRQQLRLVKSNGKWRIASEKELKVYYVNK